MTEPYKYIWHQMCINASEFQESNQSTNVVVNFNSLMNVMYVSSNS